jgi:hypothetical protein
MSRYLASFYHLLISFAVFIGLAWLVLYVWYPDFFYTIDGGWEGMRIIIGVDLVLGPLLTLIIFKAGKPGLKFDLAAIGIFQSACLLAGMFVVYSERPLFFIYYEEHFYSASADTYARYRLQPPDPSAFSDSSPAFVIATVPDDPIEEADFRRVLYQDGLPVWVYDKSYEPLGEHMATVLEGAYSVENLRDRDEEGALDDWLEEQGGGIEDYAFYPIHSRYHNPFIAIKRSDNSFAGILNIPAPFAS